jgi:hypothetical protein
MNDNREWRPDSPSNEKRGLFKLVWARSKHT